MKPTANTYAALLRPDNPSDILGQEHGNVPEQFMRWVWAGGGKLRGLIRRHQAEIFLYKI